MLLSLPSPSRILSVLFPTTNEGASSGAELVTADGRALPLVATMLRADARGGIARFVLEQTFRNSSSERLHVTYRMPLPADGAVSGYAFEIGERVITGVVDKKHQARERFERAVSEGKTAALLEQQRADIFTQQIGNVPAGEQIVARITVDAKLAWLPEGEWELRFPTVIGPRYIGQHDTIADANATHVKVTTQPLGVQVGMALTIGDKKQGRATSSTHAIETDANGVITLAAGARLDRDVVVRWPVATPSAGLSLATARPAAGDEAFGLVTIVPPARGAKAMPIARDLIVLLDTSGSMGGVPLDKAKAVVSLIIDTLTERDRFELIEFNNAPSRYLPSAELATVAAKRAAIAWVNSRVAGGGTEIREGVIEAMKTLRIGAQRQVIAVTDGYVGGEQQILRALDERLPASCRLHVLGVGSAVNRSLATALARVGRGAEVIVGPDEDPERSAKRLLDRTSMPMLTNVTITGDAVVSHAPAKVPDVFEGAPLVAAVELSPLGGTLIVKGVTADGPWEQRTAVQPLSAHEGNQAICALYARECVADLEAMSLLETPDAKIEELGLRFQISTRLTSWIAVDETRVHAGPDRTENVPHEVPYGTKAQAFGLRAAGSGPIATLGESEQYDYAMPQSAPSLGRASPAPMMKSAFSTRAGGPPPTNQPFGGPPGMPGGSGGGGAPPSPARSRGVAIGGKDESKKLDAGDAGESEGGSSERRSRSVPPIPGAAIPRSPAPPRSAPPSETTPPPSAQFDAPRGLPALDRDDESDAAFSAEETTGEHPLAGLADKADISPSAPAQFAVPPPPARPLGIGAVPVPERAAQAPEKKREQADEPQPKAVTLQSVTPPPPSESQTIAQAPRSVARPVASAPQSVAQAPQSVARAVAHPEPVAPTTKPAPTSDVEPVYKTPPRLWLWIVLALLLGLLAALAWWFLS